MRLPLPHPGLRACVVVPARNEEALIGACLNALATQQRISHDEYEILLVLDTCTDATEQRARAVAAEHPSLRLHLLDGPGRGAGHARRVGMESACARLLGLGRERGLIASTDADTVVAPDWLAAQLEAASRGASAIGGRIELSDDGTVPEGLLDWHAERGRRRHLKLLSDPNHPQNTEHWQFSGASLALTAATYRRVGGIEPLAALEDESLERVLIEHGIPIERLLSVRVKTSARLVGRAPKGLARDLAAAAARLEAESH
jgi:glucosyl-3-phosphoglycerate synthase